LFTRPPLTNSDVNKDFSHNSQGQGPGQGLVKQGPGQDQGLLKLY